MLKKILPVEAYQLFMDDKTQLVDIRSEAEFAQISIKGSLLAPLPVLSLQKIEEKQNKELIFLCRSGKRTENAAKELYELFPNAKILDGGIEAWKKADLPLRLGKNQPMPLDRQILIAAGSLVLLGVLGSLVWNPLLFLAGFVGAGLVFAGVSGICGLGKLLMKMPWNK